MFESFIGQKKKRLKEELRKLQVRRALSSPKKPVVKVYGLLRTGTNYLTKLIDLNFDVFCLQSTEHGWKHGLCQYETDIQYVFAVKDPYSWLISFMEWEIIHKRYESNSISDFIRRPITHPQLKTAWRNDDVVSAWSQSLNAWQSVAADNTIYIRYEDISASLESELGKIRDQFCLKQKQKELMNLEKRADDWKTPLPRKTRHDNYYQDAHYLEQFTEDDLQMIREKLDPELVAKFGYKIL